MKAKPAAAAVLKRPAAAAPGGAALQLNLPKPYASCKPRPLDHPKNIAALSALLISGSVGPRHRSNRPTSRALVAAVFGGGGNDDEYVVEGECGRGARGE
eukprot:3621803-Pyramimonas_sp.AAC.1